MKCLGELTRDQVVLRAHSAIGHATPYKLGAGGRDPFSKLPGNGTDFACDCSGFVAWAFGVDRYLPNGEIPHLLGGDWLETSNVYRDALSPYGFAAIIPWSDARPADVLVYPDREGRQGHIGVISKINGFGADRVIHCSLGNWNEYHDAIRETDAVGFQRHGAITARIAWVRSGDR